MDRKVTRWRRNRRADNDAWEMLVGLYPISAGCLLAGMRGGGGLSVQMGPLVSRMRDFANSLLFSR